MKDFTKSLSEPSRRDFVQALSATCLGVTAASLTGCKPTTEPVAPAVPQQKPKAAQALRQEKLDPITGRPTAKSVIYLYLAGGMTHVDSWDPKDDKEAMAMTRAIGTNVDGIRVGHWLENTAKHMDKVCVVNSMNTTQGAHGPGNYFMHTSYTKRASIKHPRMGSWVAQLTGPINSNLPASVFVGSDSVGGGAGFLPARLGSLGIGNPDEGLKNSRLPKGVTEAEFRERLKLANFLDTQFHGTAEAKQVQAYTDMYTDALRMMRSEDLKGFDISDESQVMKDHYGSSKFGRGCLLARRLVEHGVRFVEVSNGGWDMHGQIEERLEEKMVDFDRVYAALLSDLAMRGMLEETLVVVATEFGRTPEISTQGGRNHFPKAFSCTLAGGGIRGGQLYGKTDKNARNILENKVSVPDFNATIAYAMGLPYNEIVYSPSKRPFSVADTGEPLVNLFG